MKMYSLAVLFTFIGVSLALPVHHETESSLIYVDRVNRTIECIKTLCNKGKPEIGLPSYDPFILPDINLDLSEMLGSSHLRGNVSLKAMKFFDVLKFTLTHIEATKVRHPDALKLRLVAEWPVYSFEGEYDIDAIIKGNSIKGKGSIRETFTKLRYDISFQTALPLKPEEFSIKLSLEGVKFHLDELIINGENVTDDINKSANRAAEWVKQHADVFNQSLTAMVLNIINSAYSKDRMNRDVIAEHTKCWNDSA